MQWQRDSHIKSTHKYSQLYPVEKKETGERTGEPAWPRTAHDVQPAVWPRQRKTPTKNLLVTASQKSWSWDKADVCPLLRTALGIINYRDLRDFINNFRHTDTKITFVFLSKGLGFLRVKILLTVTGKERQTVQSEAQLKVQAAACSGPEELIPCWHGKMYHGASCLKTSSLFSLHSMSNKPMINVNIQPELSGASQWWQENLCHARLSA